MCFCATASFGMGSVLISLGSYAVAQAWRGSRAHVVLATVPLIFGIQQLAEGMVWLDLNRGRSDTSIQILIYLFFATFFWPGYIPLCMLFVEPARRFRLLLIGVGGVAIGLSLYLPILFDPGRYLVVEISRHSILYDCSRVPILRFIPEPLMRGLYLAAVTIPFLMATDRRLRWFGGAVFVSAVIAELLFRYAFASVWCFFAAGLSAYLAVYLHQLTRTPAPVAPGRPA
jgi:hypothetical protein